MVLIYPMARDAWSERSLCEYWQLNRPVFMRVKHCMYAIFHRIWCVLSTCESGSSVTGYGIEGTSHHPYFLSYLHTISGRLVLAFTITHSIQCACHHNPTSALGISLKYRKIFNISRTQSQNLNEFRLVLQLSLPNPLNQVLSRRWRCSWSSADRRCSNYIWLISNFIAYSGGFYIRGLTVHVTCVGTGQSKYMNTLSK